MPRKSQKKPMEILPPITEEMSDDLKDFATDLFKDCPELLEHILDPDSEWKYPKPKSPKPQKSIADLFKDHPDLLGHITDPDSEWKTQKPKSHLESLHRQTKTSTKGQSRY